MQPQPPLIERWSACGPADAAARLRDRPGLAWLDSSLVTRPGGAPSASRMGRWSIVASDPRWTLAGRAGEVWVSEAERPRALPAGALHAFAQRVDDESRGLLGTLAGGAPAAATAELAGLPFVGGAIGYLGFELAREVERLPATTNDDVGVPDLSFGWYDAALVWDHAANAGWLVGRRDAVDALRARLRRAAAPLPLDAPPRGGALRVNMSRECYIEAVERALRYIVAGDIYQVNFAQRFSVVTSEAGFDLYRRLRQVSPAPFAAYLDARHVAGGVEVLSSSPERFLLADGERLETRPIKGTRPRGATPELDARLGAELLASAKDRAEHVMIVDLERNDLGRVAAIGSVAVPEFAALESFAQVHHLTSTVTARRRTGVGLEALLRATFPGGSISGAPKIRALEIIDELEPTARGVYTGAIGYVSAHGRVDLNIAIRTITLKQQTAHFHVGGAIVFDSDPEAEYQETLTKARGMARALGVELPDEAAAAVVAPGAGATAR